jgi:hypothetical protein
MLGALLGALGVAMGVLTLLPSAPTQAVLAAALIFSGCKLRADKGLAPAPPLACRDAPLLAPAGGVSGGEESAAWGGGGRQQLRACSILITGANSGERAHHRGHSSNGQPLPTCWLLVAARQITG